MPDAGLEPTNPSLQTDTLSTELTGLTDLYITIFSFQITDALFLANVACYYRDPSPSFTFGLYCITGVWNYQILLLVHGQVNGQNPLVQPRFTCQKIVIFSYFSKKTY